MGSFQACSCEMLRAQTPVGYVLSRLQSDPGSCFGLMEQGRLKGIIHADSIVASIDTDSLKIEKATALDCASTSFAMTASDTPLSDFLQEHSSGRYEHIVVTNAQGQLKVMNQDSLHKVKLFHEKRIKDILPSQVNVPLLNEDETCLKGLELLSLESNPYVISIGPDGPTGVVTRKDISRAIETHQNLWEIRIADVAQTNISTVRDDLPAREALCALEGSDGQIFICQCEENGGSSVVEAPKMRKALASILDPIMQDYDSRTSPKAVQRQLSDVLIERAMSDTMDIGVIALSPNLEIQYTNKTARELLGSTYDFISNESVHALSQSVPVLQSVVESVGSLDPEVNPVIDLTNDTGLASNYQTKLTGVWENGAPSGFILTIQDSTDVRLAETKLRKLAYYDALTGLPNRTLLFERLSMEIRKSRRGHDQFAVIFVDLDGFKAVNDQYGHRCGDDLLVQVAARFARVLRDSDTVARLGGDEFLFILPGASSCEMARVVSQKIRESLGTPFVVSDVSVSISASFGTAYYPDNGLTPEELIDFADKEMYELKRVPGKG